MDSDNKSAKLHNEPKGHKLPNLEPEHSRAQSKVRLTVSDTKSREELSQCMRIPRHVIYEARAHAEALENEQRPALGALAQFMGGAFAI